MRYADINWSRLPVAGVPGLLVVIAVVVLTILAAPYLLWLIVPAAVVGVVGGLIVNWRRNR